MKQKPLYYIHFLKYHWFLLTELCYFFPVFVFHPILLNCFCPSILLIVYLTLKVTATEKLLVFIVMKCFETVHQYIVVVKLFTQDEGMAGHHEAEEQGNFTRTEPEIAFKELMKRVRSKNSIAQLDRMKFNVS